MIRENRVYREGSDKTAPPGDPFQAVGPRIGNPLGNPPTSPVTAKFEELCATAACIDETLKRLANRLEPVMSSYKPVATAEKANVQAAHSQHYNNLAALHDHLLEIHGHMVGILDLLEI